MVDNFSSTRNVTYARCDWNHPMACEMWKSGWCLVDLTLFSLVLGHEMDLLCILMSLRRYRASLMRLSQDIVWCPCRKQSLVGPNNYCSCPRWSVCTATIAASLVLKSIPTTSITPGIALKQTDCAFTVSWFQKNIQWSTILLISQLCSCGRIDDLGHDLYIYSFYIFWGVSHWFFTSATTLVPSPHIDIVDVENGAVDHID